MSTKRSGWITGVVVLQLVYVLVLLVLTLYLLVLTRTPETRNGSHAAEAISGLRIAALVLGGPALAALAAWFGLWKLKRWGWWLTIVTDLVLAAAFAYSLVDDGWNNIDGAVVVLTVIAVLPVICLLLPRVRKSYWHGNGSEVPAGASKPASQNGAKVQKRTYDIRKHPSRKEKFHRLRHR